MPAHPPIRATNRALLISVAVLVLLAALGTLVAFLIYSMKKTSVSDRQPVQEVSQHLGQPGPMHSVTLDNGRTLDLPQGFTISRSVKGRGALRMMAVTPDGYLLVTEKDQGNVLAYPLADNAPAAVTMASGLRIPSGIAFHEGYVWVAEETQVSRFPYQGGGRAGSQEIVISGLPSGGHNTRTINFGPDGKLYLTIGSSCNVCEEKDNRRAAMLRANPDGSGMEIYATGLRNTVGFDWNPASGEIWGVDNGRDLMGDDLPPDKVNIIRQGRNYGWPYCYGNRKVNPEFQGNPSRAAFCQGTEPPLVELQAHSAPLGVRFLTDPAWPSAYQQNFFIGFHGSWNRSVPTGYKVVRVGTDLKVYDFITGWLDQSSGNYWGRPVDILFAGNNMYVSDDYSGTIYRVTASP